MKKLTYTHTFIASCVAYTVQAMVNCFTPLVFFTFTVSYGVTLEQLALLSAYNFGVQFLLDATSTVTVDRLGYRKSVVIAHFLASLGLFLLGLLPRLIDPFAGLLIATTFTAAGGGTIEVVLSPAVEAIPVSGHKASMMSILHSFYCWGQMAVVLLSTLFFVLFSTEKWYVMAMLWAIIPFLNLFAFLFVPLTVLPSAEKDGPRKKKKRDPRFLLMLLMVLCAGAAEIVISQWASDLAESTLHLNKTLGDLVGPCGFAFCMGITRILHAKLADRVPLPFVLLFSGLLGIFSFLLVALSPWPILSLLGCALSGVAVAVLWPGTYSLAAAEFPGGGTPMFALLALFGDTGCAIGPLLVGTVSGAFGDDLTVGVLFGTVFPFLLCITVLAYLRLNKKRKNV